MGISLLMSFTFQDFDLPVHSGVAGFKVTGWLSEEYFPHLMLIIKYAHSRWIQLRMCEMYETWSMKLDLGCNWWWAYRLRANWVSPYIFFPTIFTTVNFDMSIHCWLLCSSSYFTFVTQLYFLNNLTLSSLVALSLGNQGKKRE